jgi:hypothetical protein
LNVDLGTMSAEVNMSDTQHPFVILPRSVRQTVIEQHKRLRDLLRIALDASTGALQGSRCDLLTLARVTREMELRFLAHLHFEETALGPILARADQWGPERVRALYDEHARQRAEMRTVVEGIEGGWTPDTLAVALRSLATDLFLDMDEEERGCLHTIFDEPSVGAVGEAHAGLMRA